jgi:hypothetical protein
LPPSSAVVMKSGNLNFLEPSGPLQAGNGADCFTFFNHSNLKACVCVCVCVCVCERERERERERPIKLIVWPADITQTGVYSACGNLSYGIAPSCPNTDGQTAEIRVPTGDMCLHRQRMYV